MHSTYKKMIYKMLEKDRGTVAEDPWTLYILRCNDGSLYTGVTKNMDRRLQMHQKGKASRYTRTRLPVELLYQEPCGGRARALVRECEVKAYSKKFKERLVVGEALPKSSVKNKKEKRRKKSDRKKSK
ncbi:MAG TPA: GIY-YIG nuclease family protein [Verrucomicrobiae bacterium]|jgi:putative endonuclease|nr:GIY-YIG nuclease family protein [Verrucomicrobiae bacterium]